MKVTNPITKTIIIAFAFKFCNAQNLVPNAGFETIITCPIAPAQLFLATSWDSLNASPDLFNSCNDIPTICSVDAPVNFAGNSNAHTGKGYAGIVAKTVIANYREYVQVPLTAPLVSGKIYKIEAWFKRSSNSTYAVSSLGLTLSVGALSQSGNSNLGFPPQVESASVIADTANWTLVSGYIIAVGGENHLTIGNFRDDANSGAINVSSTPSLCFTDQAYYYIDDVKVEIVNEQLSISGDTIICPGTYTTLHANTNTIGWWSIASNPAISISNATDLIVSPAINTTYVLNGIYYKDSVTINVIAPPVVNLGADTIICETNAVTLTAENLNAVYQWSTGETTASIEATENTNYWVNVDNGGCSVSDTIGITVLTNTPIPLGIDSVYCSFNFDFITLDAGIGTNYLWQPTFEDTRKITVSQPGTYTVTVNYANGCTRDSSITIKEVCEPAFFIPTSFTPDDNNINDLLCPVGNSFETFEFAVYNRWGELIFVSTNTSVCWDGKMKGKKAPIGVYAYSLTFTHLNSSGIPEKGQKSGTITLIR